MMHILETSDTSRIFVAVPLPGDVKAAIAKACTKLKRVLSFRRWVYEDDYHITLRFLGDTEHEKIDNVKDVVREVAADHRPFELSVQGLGTFGMEASPRVLWAGVQGDLDALHALQTDTERCAVKLGFLSETRPYRPHLTIARKYAGNAGFSELMESGSTGSFASLLDAPQTWTVDRIVIYRTHMGREPMYESIAQCLLGRS